LTDELARRLIELGVATLHEAAGRRRQPLTLTEPGQAILRSAQALLRNRLAMLLADMPAPGSG